MRTLRHLAKQTVRSRPAAVSRLMAYLPAAVTAGYLREPDTELPCPETNWPAASTDCSPRQNVHTPGRDGPIIRLLIADHRRLHKP